MVAPAVLGIELFKIAGRSIPGWMKSLKPGNAGPSSRGSTPSSGPVNLTYWSWIAGMDKQVALFNQTHPTIHVTWSNVSSGPVAYNKLFTAIKANTEPEVEKADAYPLF
jgi:ABC-type glycerol-3-phosphate transport system substrate-binding protein